MKIDDERVQFYLRHREQLEEWLGLRGDAAAAIDDWLASLSGDIEALAFGQDSDVEVVTMVDAQEMWPAFYLRRNTWPGLKDGRLDEGIVAIGFQWARNKTFLVDRSMPFVGVRVKSDNRIGRALSADLEFQAARRKRKDSQTPWWRAFAYVPPDSPFPEKADDYRNRLIASLDDAWKAYAISVDRAVRAESVSSSIPSG